MRRSNFASLKPPQHESTGCWLPNLMTSHQFTLPPRRSLASRRKQTCVNQGYPRVCLCCLRLFFFTRPLNGKQVEPLKLLMSRKNAIHTSFFAQWGTSLQDLERTPESSATTAYGAFLIDMGLQGRFDLICAFYARKFKFYQGDTSVLVMAVAACLVGYGEVGLWLKREAQKPDSWVVWEGNPYLEWIEEYAGEEYQAGVVAGLSEYAHSFYPLEPRSSDRFPSPPCRIDGTSGRRGLSIETSVQLVVFHLGENCALRESILGHGVEPIMKSIRSHTLACMESIERFNSI